MILEIKRGAATVATVEIDESTGFLQKLMADHKIRTEFYTPAPLPLQLGDHIVVAGTNYSLNRLPELQKINNKTYKYSAELEGPEYGLYNKLLMYDGLSEFDYTGSPADFVALIVAQQNQIDPGWSVGSIDSADEKRITFSNTTCRQALTQVASEFKMEFDIASKAISLKTSVGTATSYRFEYGRDDGISKGLYKLTRVQVSDQNIVTRVYGFGGSTNIASDYRNRAKKLIFESKYLEANTALYGIIEGVFNDENIYPKRTGNLTGVHVELKDETDYDPNLSYVEDTSIDFDINAYLIAGQTAKIVFKSGDLSGQEFEIWKYDHTAKRIYFSLFEESDGYVLPNSLNLPATGDTYTLINISMPQSYIDDKEDELQVATQEFLNQNSVPQVTYQLEIDPKYVKDNSISIKVGDLVTIVDTSLGINSLIRVMQVEYPLVNPNKVKATISDTVLYTTSERVILEQVKTKQNVVTMKRQTLENARRNTAAFKRLRDYLIDADNEFDQDLITAKRIAALLIESGTSAGDFILHSPVPTFLDNYGGNANAFLAPGCTLSHLEISIPITVGEGEEATIEDRYDWTITEGSFADLVPASEYYLYAKCSKAEQTAVWVLTPDVIKSNQEGFYYFPAGTLLPVDEKGIRTFKTGYGKTWINGRMITTGRVQSISGANYMDLDSEQFKFGGIDVNVSEADTTTLQNVKIKGSLIVGPDGGSFPLGRPRGAYVPGTPYYKGDEVTDGGSTWMYINDVPSDEALAPAPVEGVYWHVTAAKGDTGATGLPGADGSDGSAGADSRYCTLTAAAMAVGFDTAGNTPSPSSILLTAMSYNMVGTAYYEFFENDSSLGSPSTTNTKTLSLTGRVYAEMPRKIEVQVREGSSVGTIVARDQISIIGMKAGQNAVQGIIENSSHTVPSSSTGVVSSYTGSGTKIQVYEGATLLTFNTVLAAGRFTVGTPVVSPAGKITVGARSGSGTTICTVADHSAMDSATDVVTITYPITASKADGTDVTFNMVQTITKSKQGTTGDPGTPAPYYEYRYAANGSTVVYPAITVTDRNPVNYSMAKPAVETMQTLWYTIAKVSADGSTLLENWTTPEKMAVNNNGSYNPTPVDRETYSGTALYHGGTDYIDMVYSSGRFYYARIDAGDIPAGTAPTNTAYWNPFEAKVPNIATGLLLADLAYIRNLGVRYVKTAESGKRIFIDGDNNVMILYDSDGNETARIDDDIDYGQAGNPLGGLKAKNPANDKVTYVTANGVFNNGSGVSFLSATLGITTNANLVGLLQTRNSDANGYSAAVVGVDQTTSGNSKSYAGFFLGKVRGSTVVESFMKTPSDRGLYDLPDSDATLSSTYSSDKKYFFWGGAKTAGRVYNLPDPADYESGEIIWFANGNDYRSELKARYGDTINGYAYNARWFTLNGPTDFVEFMSNGSSMWRIVRSGGDNVVF
ncbi:MAG: phage tail protein [Mangrovibacterium sp.]